MTAGQALRSTWLFLSGEVSLMVITTAVGIGLAIGHHLFYNSLNGSEPSNEVYQIWGVSGGLSQQQVNLAAGATFAFFVKTFLGIALSTAQEQTIWRFIKSRPTRLSAIDGLFESKDNLFSILNFKLWGLSPISMMLAAIYWLLPLSSLFPPATLTIQAMEDPRAVTMAAPIIDFTSMNLANIPVTGQDRYQFSGPQFEVQRLVMASMAGGQILPISPAFANSSWSRQFYGPVVKCDQVSPDLLADIVENMEEYPRASQTGIGQSQNSKFNMIYVAWVPDRSEGRTAVLPSVSGSLKSGSLGPLIDGAKNISLFVAALNIYEDKYSAVQCVLKNASYSTDFTFTNGNQQVTTVVHEPFLDFSFLPFVEGKSPLAAKHPDGSDVYTPDGKPVFNSSLVERFGYQAVMHAFNDGLVGFVEHGVSGVINNGGTGSEFLIPRAKELSFISDQFYNVTGRSLPGTPGLWDGTSIMLTDKATMTMAEAIEEMFINATVSLMSSDLLQPNYTSPYAPGEITVESALFHNVYVYSVSILWVTYATAIGLTLFTVLVGLFVVVRNDGSYTYSFSTVLRVAHNLGLSESLVIEDTDGKSPPRRGVEEIVVTFLSKDSRPVSEDDYHNEAARQ